MTSAREHLYARLKEGLEEAGGFLDEGAEELLDQLVERVMDDPRSDGKGS